jgi:hypothetical protein
MQTLIKKYDKIIIIITASRYPSFLEKAGDVLVGVCRWRTATKSM